METKKEKERVELKKVITFLGFVCLVCTFTGAGIVERLAANSNSYAIGWAGFLLSVGGGFFLCLSLKFLNDLWISDEMNRVLPSRQKLKPGKVEGREGDTKTSGS